VYKIITRRNASDQEKKEDLGMTNGKSFDYIIVGAGSAGCILAARLSEDADVKVLLLEAGGKDSDPLIHIPLGMGKMHEHRMHDWGYDGEPEPRMNNRVIEAMRGKVIGGSSSINVMAYVRGHRGDYDRWAQKGATGWSYSDIVPYMRRCESWEGGEDTYRGGNGPMVTQWARNQDPIFQDWSNACVEAGYQLTDDYNGKQQEGFGVSQSTQKGGTRCSAAVAYLHPAKSRPNLTVETKAYATRVIMDGKKAVGVEYEQGGQIKTANAEREVLLSGGVFNSPQLLMLSGIGPADHLKDVGIDPIINLPGVGQNLQDHLAVLVHYARKDTDWFHALMRFDKMAAAMVQAYLFKSGPATILPGGLHGYVKSRPELAVPDLQFLFRGTSPNAHLWFPGIKKAYDEGFGMRPVLLHPESRGQVTLRSNNPRDPVRIFQNFFDSPNDLPLLREGVKRIRDIIGQPAMDARRGAELAPGPDCKTDDQIDEFIRQKAVTAHHPSCTCQMGASEECVLDSELKVRGAENLRVIDASAMPDLISGNINAAVLMIAEKGAAMVRGETALPSAEAA
jgi:4-pyridoxate dehydrogenase